MAKVDERIQNERVERIRQMIEGKKDDPELFSSEYISRAQADLAVQRHVKEPGEPGTVAPEKGDLKEAIEPDLDAIFSDVRLSVLDAIEQGDKVVVRWRLRGRWTGPLPFARQVKPTGKAVDFTGINIYRFVGGRIVEKTGEFDSATLARQAIGGLNPAQCQEALTAASRPPELIGSGFGPLV